MAGMVHMSGSWKRAIGSKRAGMKFCVFWSLFFE